MVHRSTYRGLAPEETSGSEEQAASASAKLEESIETKLGPGALVEDFGDLGVDDTPGFESYEDSDADGLMPDPRAEELEPMPEAEAGDNYIITEIMIP